MDREKLQREGRLSVKEKDRKKLELKIRGLIESVRLHLDPLEMIEDLDMDVAHQEMNELADTWADYRQILKDMAATRKALGQ